MWRFWGSLDFFSHHKCATRWFETYLRSVAALNGLEFASTSRSVATRLRRRGIRFFSNALYSECRGRRGVHVIRNPLMIVLSAYYSHLRSHPLERWPELAEQRKRLAACDFETGLFETIRFLDSANFHQRSPSAHTAGPLYALKTWDYDDPDFSTLRVEDLVRAPAQHVRRATRRPVRLPADEDFGFARFSGGRPAGQTDLSHHYRSGDDREWTTLPAGIVRSIRATHGFILERFYPEALAP